MSSKRIVLVDPLGDVLFSGESMIVKEAETADTCPETKRSAGSGVFRAAERVVVVDVEGDDESQDDAAVDTEVPTQRNRDGRAA
jgi:hypothetical protein